MSMEPISMAPMSHGAPGVMEPAESMAPGRLSDPGRESMMAERPGRRYGHPQLHGFESRRSSPATQSSRSPDHHGRGRHDGHSVAEVPIPAGGDAVLEPGGYHVMLVGLVAPLEVGQAIEVELEFRTAAPQTVTVPVQAMGPMGAVDDDGADDEDGADDDY
jgi:hypothetical protein